MSSGVHQLASRPSASNWLPWSSKLWLISWPMTVPIAAVVLNGIARGVVERRIQDRGREVQRVLERQVHGVDGLRRHRPLGLVDGLAELGERSPGSRRAPSAPDCRAHRLARSSGPSSRASARDIRCRRRASSSFAFAFSRVAGEHPGERVDAAVEGGHDVAHHRPAPGPWPPAESISPRTSARPRRRERRWSAADRALPAVPRLGRARQRRPVEAELLVGEGARQQAGGAIERRGTSNSPSTSRAARCPRAPRSRPSPRGARP